jgi:hypothetical protein
LVIQEGCRSITARIFIVALKMTSAVDEWLKSFASTDLGDSSVAIPAVVLVAALVFAFWAYRRQSSAIKESVKETASSKDQIKVPKLSKTSSEDSPASEIEIESSPSNSDATKDVWADRRKKGIAAASSHGVKTAVATEKQFRTSYYYAHNNPGATGGYSDGLNMEDFTMNGPRLLSRSGTTPMVSQEDMQPPEVDPAATAPVSIPTSADSVESKPATPEKTTLLIARYLWDDPGDSSGVANIRIEQLPGLRSTDIVLFKDIVVSEASAEITGDGGLLVIVRTTSTFD